MVSELGRISIYVSPNVTRSDDDYGAHVNSWSFVNRWREQMMSYCAQCLAEQRAFVPSVIFDATKQDLVTLGLKASLADRFTYLPVLVPFATWLFAI